MTHAAVTYTYSSDRIDSSKNYRFLSIREWDSTLPSITFITLNHSTTPERRDDETIRRCVEFARTSGYGSMRLVALYAYRSRSFQTLREAGWPVGPNTDNFMDKAIRESSTVVCCWGWWLREAPDRFERVAAVKRMVYANGREVSALNINRDGSPANPLQLDSLHRLVPFDLELYEKTLAHASAH